MSNKAETTDPQLAAAQETRRVEAERWYDQMRAAEYGNCPRPVSGKPFDIYAVHSSAFTGNDPLRDALAATNGHVFITDGADDEQAWCIRCDHLARIWPGDRVFIRADVSCFRA